MKKNTLILFSILFALINLPAQISEFLPTSNGVIIEHTFYTLSYIEKHEQAEWVAYELTKQDVNGTTKRTNSYRPDPTVSTETANSYDYKRSGYDRGHLAPAGDMKRSRLAMSESFFFSNMSPQVASFNQGIWNQLEIRVREWANQKEKIYIVTGPVLNSIVDTIGINKVSVPAYYYKVLLSFENGHYKTIALLLPNKTGTMTLPEYVVKVDELEQITGIDFWSSLPDTIENKIENNSNSSDWFSSRELKKKYVKESVPINVMELQEGQINSVQARDYFDKEMTVCGCVVSASYLKRTSATYLNLDKKYPHQIFTVTIFGENRNNFSEKPEEKYFGKKVCVKGIVKNLKGLPSINILGEKNIWALD